MSHASQWYHSDYYDDENYDDDIDNNDNNDGNDDDGFFTLIKFLIRRYVCMYVYMYM
jgi:hypothetical protein